MMRRVKSAVWTAVLLCLLLGAVWAVNRTLTQKYGYYNSNPLDKTFSGFYDMDPGSVDVLFFGSSHMGSGINPQELYDNFGIRGYNLGSNSQPMWISYYWLLEALQYQSPKAVVLDCYTLYIDGTEHESAARQALDSMRSGAVKREAVKTVCGLDEEQSPLSYFLMNIRFHTRWTGLNENDFLWGERDPVPMSKGFWRYINQCGDEKYEPFKEDMSAGMEEFLPEPGEYLDKITELCREKGISLILVKTPTHFQTQKKHNAIAAYAEEHGLAFYDFNEIKMYKFIGFSYPEDMNDSSTSGNKNAHANPSGAKKMTLFIGQVLSREYGLPAVWDAQYEASRKFNDSIETAFELHNEESLESYLPMLKNPRYTVWIASRGEAFEGLSETQKEALKTLGLKINWDKAPGSNYLAVIDGGEIVYQKLSEEELETSGSFRGGQAIYQLASTESSGSIKINNSEKSKNKRGLNIVVYDNEYRTVIDAVCFDTHEAETKVSR